MRQRTRSPAIRFIPRPCWVGPEISSRLMGLTSRKPEQGSAKRTVRQFFPDYYPISSQENIGINQHALFCIDANVLLNLYRYSDKTRNELLHVLELVIDRLWFPYQAALEYQ